MNLFKRDQPRIQAEAEREWFPCFQRVTVTSSGTWDYTQVSTYERFDRLVTSYRFVMLNNVKHYEVRLCDGRVTYLPEADLRFPEKAENAPSLP